MNRLNGAITLISPPASVKTGKKESNSTIFFFQERENLRLSSNVSVDISSPGSYPSRSLTPGTISVGTPVDSYFFHFDRKGSSANGIRLSGSVIFDEEILGVIVSKTNHNKTRSILGNPGTSYAIDKAITEFNNNTDRITWSGRTLTVSLKTFHTIDQVRVITESSSSASVPPTVTVPPTLTSLILNGSSSSNLTISEGQSVWASVSATDPDQESISFFLNGRSIGTDAKKSGIRSKSTSLAFPDNGNFTYRAHATDQNGKLSSSITRTVTVNNIAPTFSFNFSSNVINEGQSASAFLSATDPGADAISFFFNGNFISTDFRSSGTRSANSNLGILKSDGTFSYFAQARDDDGANSNITTQRLTVNNVAPNLSFRLSSNVINEGQSASAFLSATDPGADIISFYLDNQLIHTDFRTSGTRSANSNLGTFQDDGTFTYLARSRDDDANSNTITQTLTVKNVAPTINFTLSNNVIDEGQSVEVQMSATDPGADAISFLLDGNLISTDTRTSGIREASTSLSYEDDGTFFIIAQAQDDDDVSNSIQKSLTVKNVAPTITSLTEDLSIGTNNNFSFEATATDPGLADILTYEWDLDGDGEYDDFTGSSGEWSFSEPGDHEVKLRVSDGDGGVDEDSFIVTAEELKLPEPYSFRFTDIKAVSDDPEGDKFQLSFEIINWTDTPAAGIKIALNDATNLVKIGEKYPEFAGATVDENGRPLGPDRDPLTGNLNIPNNGTVKAWDKTSIEWNITGDPIVNRDLLGAISTSEAIALVPGSELIFGSPSISDIEAVDNGDNVRDGFVFTVDHINESEILSFDMSLLDENGNPINSGSDSYNYGSGVVTIYRHPHKEATNPDALFINSSANHPEGTGIPKELEELFYNNVNRVTEFV